jgi:MoxR-like ATPase
VTTLRKKFNRIETDLNEVLVEMNAEIHGAVAALVSGTHMFILGPPGISKSYLIDHLLARVGGAKTFSILMGNFTGPEDVFGPMNIPALKESRHERELEGYLPWADFAWLDEIWNANDAIMKSLHEATNERRYRHGTQKIDIPLSSMFCASNVLPVNDDLSAIYDRILQRFDSRRIQEPANFICMLGMDAPLRDVKPIVTLAEVHKAIAEVRKMPIHESVYEAVAEIRQELAEENIFPSDRRYKQALVLLQAEAWLEGFDQVGIDQVTALSSVLWSDPEQIVTIDRILSEKANPRERECLELLADIGKIGELVISAVNDDDRDRAQTTGIEAHPKILAAMAAIKGIREDPKITARQRVLIEQCSSTLKTHSQDLLNKVWDMDDAAIAKMHEEASTSDDVA